MNEAIFNYQNLAPDKFIDSSKYNIEKHIVNLFTAKLILNEFYL
jgi:hypothetical protein